MTEINSLNDLVQRLIAYKCLPEPHYQAIGEHLIDVAEDIGNEIKEMRKYQEEQIQNRFNEVVDKIAREGKGLQLNIGDYIYFVNATKVHKDAVKYNKVTT